MATLDLQGTIMEQANVVDPMVMVSLFFWLGVFLIISSIINKFKKNLVVNGAEWFFWIMSAFFIWSSIIILRPKPGAIPEIDPYYHFGQLLGAYFIPMLLAGYLSLRFRKKRKLVVTNESEIIEKPAIDATSEESTNNWNESKDNKW